MTLIFLLQESVTVSGLLVAQKLKDLDSLHRFFGYCTSASISPICSPYLGDCLGLVLCLVYLACGLVPHYVTLIALISACTRPRPRASWPVLTWCPSRHFVCLMPEGCWPTSNLLAMSWGTLCGSSCMLRGC